MSTDMSKAELVEVIKNNVVNSINTIRETSGLDITQEMFSGVVRKTQNTYGVELNVNDVSDLEQRIFPREKKIATPAIVYTEPSAEGFQATAETLAAIQRAKEQKIIDHKAKKQAVVTDTDSDDEVPLSASRLSTKVEKAKKKGKREEKVISAPDDSWASRANDEVDYAKDAAPYKGMYEEKVVSNPFVTAATKSNSDHYRQPAAPQPSASLFPNLAVEVRDKPSEAKAKPIYTENPKKKDDRRKDPSRAAKSAFDLDPPKSRPESGASTPKDNMSEDEAARQDIIGRRVISRMTQKVNQNIDFFTKALEIPREDITRYISHFASKLGVKQDNSNYMEMFQYRISLLTLTFRLVHTGAKKGELFELVVGGLI